MPITHHPLTDQHKREICSWQYPEPYSAYNYPSYEEMSANQSGFMNPDREKNFHGFSIDGTLIGFVNILEEPAEIFIGIGVHPDHCSKGYGKQILEMTADLAHELYPGKPLYLEVRTWNQRAVNCYLRAGFHIDGEPFEQVTGMGPGEFYRMIREIN